MSTSSVTRGRDGRHVQVFSSEDVKVEIWKLIAKCDLKVCEKWIIFSAVDLMELTGLSFTQVKEVQANAAKKLCPDIHLASELGISSVTLSFGSEKLDSAFGSMLKAGSLLEVWGEAGSGKTQLALQMCSALSPDHHSAYISTEGVVSTSRLFDMCIGKGFNKAKCEIQNCTSIESLTECVMKQLPILISSKPIKLIVIDSIAAPFRAGEIGDGIKRVQKIRSIGQQLKYFAHQHNLLVVVLNQATENPTTGLMPALGMTWSYLVNSRLSIQKLEAANLLGLRRITVQKASCLKTGKYVDCRIQKEGII